EEQDDIITSTRSEVLLDRVNSKIDRQKLIIRFSEEMIDELKDNYISYNTYRLNKIISVLTLISAVFVPLTLITCIYSMNFEIMPELKWVSEDYLLLSLMLVISTAMLGFYKYKGWM